MRSTVWLLSVLTAKRRDLGVRLSGSQLSGLTKSCARYCGHSIKCAVIIGLLPLAAQGQPAITNVRADNVSHSSARISADVSGSFVGYAQFGTTSAYGWRSEVHNASSTSLVLVITGMKPETSYHYRICNAAYTPPAGCTGDNQITTAVRPASHPAHPAPPVPVVTTYNGGVPDGTNYPSTVNDDAGPFTIANPDCSDFQAKLNLARARDGNSNPEVIIPAGTTCYGIQDFGTKTGTNPAGTGTIVVRTSAYASLPPPGARPTLDHKQHAVTFVNPAIPDTQSANDPPSCWNRNYYWSTVEAGINKYKICTATNTWSLVSAQAGYSEGTTVPGSCTAGTYFFKTDATPNPRYGLYYCTPRSNPSQFVRLEPTSDGRYSIAVPTRDSGGSAVYGYRFVGLQFIHADEQIKYNTTQAYVESGAVRVLFDRCFWLSGNDGAGAAAYIGGSHVGVIDSYIAVRPSANPTGVGGATVLSIAAGAGPFVVRNNYIKGSNVLVFVNDDSSTPGHADIDISRNHLEFDLRTKSNDPSFDSLGERDHRAPIEFKRGQRVAIWGNLIEKFWSSTNLTTAPAIVTTPRAPADGSVHVVTDHHIYGNIVRHGSGFYDTSGQNPRDAVGRNTPVLARVLVEHNIAYDIDGEAWFSPAGNTTRGGFWRMNGGGEDYIARNNTIHQQKGTGPIILWASAPIEGLSITDNIVWLNHGSAGSADNGGGIRFVADQFGDVLPDGTTSSTATAKTKLDKFALQVPDAVYDFKNNVIVGGAAGDTAVYEPSYPANNYWPGDQAAGELAVGFRISTPSPSSDDWTQFCLNDFNSTYRNKSTNCREIGANCIKVREYQGGVYNVSVQAVTQSSATIGFAAPAGRLPAALPCEVSVSSDAFATTTRVTATTNPSIPWYQLAVFNSLLSNTAYTGIIHCNGVPGRFSFRTRP